jgi:hypothetical protein
MSRWRRIHPLGVVWERFWCPAEIKNPSIYVPLASDSPLGSSLGAVLVSR